jgi:putative flavoprotein involved in K+ transport
MASINGSHSKPRKRYDVIIVGAGAAGVGLGAIFKQLRIKRWTILERHAIGASFARWPKEMRFISPSFPSNSFGLLDLNSVAVATSPAFSLGCEHPSGQEYAAYLRGCAQHFDLPIQTGIDVHRVLVDRHGRFTLMTSAGEFHCRYLVWAAGEFQYPRVSPFPGAELCLHNSIVRSWSDLDGGEAIVIGGGESGMDAAIHLSNSGKRVRVLDVAAPWELDDNQSDPSVTLSPYTTERLRRALGTGLVQGVPSTPVTAVVRAPNGFRVECQSGESFRTSTQPILATGFEGGFRLLDELFEMRDDGFPLLTDSDESTLTPGLFLIGPSVRHDKHIFCFIYKFRQRFAVVANAIADRLDFDTSVLESYRQHAMYLDDLSCCGQECHC